MTRQPVSRLELVTECRHGQTNPHHYLSAAPVESKPCPGGSRTRLDPDRELWAVEIADLRHSTTVQDVLDALETP